MSDVDPTPDTPVTIRDALGWWRGESRGQLDQIIAALTGASGNIDAVPIVAAVQALAGPAPGSTLTDVVDKTEEVRAAVANLAITNGYLADLKAQLTTIQQVLGAGAYASTETSNIRAVLLDILHTLARYGIEPDTTSTDISSVTSLTSAGLRYVVWPANAGYSRSADGTIITPADSWSGWKVYIQSDAASCQMIDNTDNQQSIADFAVNSWVDLGGNHAISFVVNSSHNVSGHIRTTQNTANIYVSQLVTYSGGTINMVVWPSGISAGPIPSNSQDNGFIDNVFRNGDFDGWTYRLVSGANATMEIFINGLYNTRDVTSSQTALDIASTEISFYSMSGAFSVEFLSP